MNEVEEILGKLESLAGSGEYRKVYDLFKSGRDITEDCTKWTMKQPRMILENSILKRGVFNNFFSSDTVKHYNRNLLLILVGYVYYSKKPEKICKNNVSLFYNIYERVMSYFEDFDKYTETPYPTKEFYETMRRVKWTGDAKKAQKKIYDRHRITSYRVFRGGLGALWHRESSLEVLAAARAASKGRDWVLPEDVVASWKTYFKLLKTPLPEIAVNRDRSDEELDTAFESLGEYQGLNYKSLLNAMREMEMVE